MIKKFDGPTKQERRNTVGGLHKHGGAETAEKIKN